MTSAFEADFDAHAAPELFAYFGLDATYVPPGGAAAATGLKVRLVEEQPRVRNEFGHQSQELTLEIRVRQAALVRPMVGGRFEVAERGNFTIEQEPFKKNGMWICKDCRRVMDQRLNARRTGNRA